MGGAANPVQGLQRRRMPQGTVGTILEVLQLAHYSWVPRAPEDASVSQVGWGWGIKAPVLGRETRESLKPPDQVWESWLEIAVDKFMFLSGSPADL